MGRGRTLRPSAAACSSAGSWRSSACVSSLVTCVATASVMAGSLANGPTVATHESVLSSVRWAHTPTALVRMAIEVSTTRKPTRILRQRWPTGAMGAAVSVMGAMVSSGSGTCGGVRVGVERRRSTDVTRMAQRPRGGSARPEGCSDRDDRPDAAAGPHVVEGAVDVLEGAAVGDETLEVEPTGLVERHQAGDVAQRVDAAEQAADQPLARWRPSPWASR